MQWKGVLPAITTGFDDDLNVDHAFLLEHCCWLLEQGCAGIVALGSLGEGATLSPSEKSAILRTCVRAVKGSAPVVSAISSLTTTEAVELARHAGEIGCDGLMVLPPYVYRGDWREMKSHLSAIVRATPLSCMLYNNPVAYGTDFLPEQIAELAREHPNLHAVKESSTDVRRISAIRALIGDRLQICVGVDDAVLEGIAVGATGWIAGLVNAFPSQAVALFELGLSGDRRRAEQIYRWFLPLLRMDTVPKFVQLIKLNQQEVGMGNERVRPPRMPLIGPEREAALRIIREAIATRPEISALQRGQ